MILQKISLFRITGSCVKILRSQSANRVFDVTSRCRVTTSIRCELFLRRASRWRSIDVTRVEVSLKHRCGHASLRWDAIIGDCREIKVIIFERASVDLFTSVCTWSAVRQQQWRHAKMWHVLGFEADSRFRHFYSRSDPSFRSRRIYRWASIYWKSKAGYGPITSLVRNTWNEQTDEWRWKRRIGGARRREGDRATRAHRPREASAFRLRMRRGRSARSSLNPRSRSSSPHAKRSPITSDSNWWERKYDFSVVNHGICYDITQIHAEAALSAW